MKITATVNLKNGHVKQDWDFIPYDTENDEQAILIVRSWENGDIMGIPLDTSRIKEITVDEVVKLDYSGAVDISKAEFIPRVGNPN